MTKNLQHKIRRHILPVLILLIVTITLSIFASRKEGFHMDELLSYQLSNAEFNPWIVPTQPQGRLAKLYQQEIKGDSLFETLQNTFSLGADALKNRGESAIAAFRADVFSEPVWITGKQFQDYITVDENDRFNYPSVYFNVKDDNHPPLHFAAIHTLSSLFYKSGNTVLYLGCIINILAVLGCCILFIRLGRLLGTLGDFRGLPASFFPVLGMACALLYGLSSGAIATVLLIRMYGMLTFFCVLFFYLNVKKWLTGDYTKHNKLLILATAAGFLTQYFFLFYCISLFGVVLFLLLRRKEWKNALCYIRSMLIAALIGVGFFPFALSDVLFSGRGTEALGNLSQGFSGFGLRIGSFLEILITRLFGSAANAWIILGLLTAAALVCFLIRRSVARKADVKAACCPQAAPLAAMLLLPSLLYFLLAARMSPYLVDRYIMPLFPFAVMILLLAAALILRALPAGHSPIRRLPLWQTALSVLTVLFCVLNLISYDGAYLYQGYARQLELSETYRDTPAICVYDGVGYYENLAEFTNYSSTLLLTAQELADRSEKESIDGLGAIVVLVKQNVDAKGVAAILAADYDLYPTRTLLPPQESVHGDSLYLFEKNREG